MVDFAWLHILAPASVTRTLRPYPIDLESSALFNVFQTMIWQLPYRPFKVGFYEEFISSKLLSFEYIRLVQSTCLQSEFAPYQKVSKAFLEPKTRELYALLSCLLVTQKLCASGKKFQPGQCWEGGKFFVVWNFEIKIRFSSRSESLVKSRINFLFRCKFIHFARPQSII